MWAATSPRECLPPTWEHERGPAVYLDIGTNGEIAMKVDDAYYCCATAAGPAFEGAEISKGMAAITGAINHCSWDETGLHYEVIGNTAPKGLCGSGLIDGLALMLTVGAVDGTGRLVTPDEADEQVAPYLGKTAEGKNAFFFSREDEFTQRRRWPRDSLPREAIAAVSIP